MIWNKFTIGELCIKVTDGSHYSPKELSEGYPMFSVKDMVDNGFNYSAVKRISEKDFIKIAKGDCKPKKDDVLIAKDGSYLKHVFVCTEEKNEVILSSIAILRPDKKKIDSFYFKYLLISVKGMMECFVSGSALPRIVLKDFKKMKLTVPPLPTQRRIASILSAYDDLIEVNNQRIKLLEETARELYKEWFVRMRFPGHKKAKFMKGFPKEWNIKPIGKVIDYYIGGGWGNDIQDNQFATSGYVIRGTDIPGVRTGKANREVYRFHKTSNMKSRELIEGDIVFETAGGSEGQPLGRTCYITQELLDSYGDKVMAASFCKQIRTTSIPPLYLYYYLNYLYDTGMIEAFQVQSTGISNYQFEPFLKYQEIILPDDDLMQQFHDKTLIMQKQIALLGEQNTQLRQIRDRLLPRLISGKLELK